MKEAIEQVLSNETYTTNEEKVDAISKELAKLVIPKDKYNELSNRLQKTESELATVKTEYDDYKKSKMTDDEKNAEEKKKFEEQKKANAIEKSDLAVQKLLLKNGIEIKDDDTELKETLSTIVSEDYDKSIKLANGFINLINKTKDNTAKETTTKLLGSTPAPVGGTNSSSSLSKVEILNQQLQEAIKNKDPLLQTQLMTQIFQEQQKSNI
jgi:tetrahydromethanopterin S-methyltransferase subunit G